MADVTAVEGLMLLVGLLLWEFGVVALYLGMGWDDV